MNKGYRELPEWADRTDLDPRTRGIISGCRMRPLSGEGLIFLEKEMEMRDINYGDDFDVKLIKFYDECMFENGGRPFWTTAARERYVAELLAKTEIEAPPIENKNEWRSNALGLVASLIVGSIIYFCFLF